MGAAAGAAAAALSERRTRSAADPLERMLRVYLLQQWYGLADEAVEDALYESQALRGFAGIELNRDPIPDATTVLHFRHWLGSHELTKGLFEEVGAMLEERGLLMRQGTIVDATIIAAPPSTENKPKSRDPEMHQTKKGNQWHFGMEAHVGVDVASGLVHTVMGTAANEADITRQRRCYTAEEEAVFGDAGYAGADKRPELEDCEVSWNIAIKRSIIKALPKALRDMAEPVERALAQVRAVVERPFHIVKNRFHHKKLRYRGLNEEYGTAIYFVCSGQSGDRQAGAACRIIGLGASGVCRDPAIYGKTLTQIPDLP